MSLHIVRASLTTPSLHRPNCGGCARWQSLRAGSPVQFSQQRLTRLRPGDAGKGAGLTAMAPGLAP